MSLAGFGLLVFWGVGGALGVTWGAENGCSHGPDAGVWVHAWVWVMLGWPFYWTAGWGLNGQRELENDLLDLLLPWNGTEMRYLSPTGSPPEECGCMWRPLINKRRP